MVGAVSGTHTKGSLRVLFRAACSRRQGTGHLRRCLTLARLMKSRGSQVAIVTDDNDTARAVAGLQSEVTVQFVSPDALVAESSVLPSVLVIDVPVTDEQLALHPDWVRQLRRFDRSGTSVVSLGHVSSNSDCFRGVIDLYPARTVHAVNYLEGPEYLILRPGFVAGRDKVDSADDGPLLVAMGGSDPFDLTRCALQSLVEAGFRGDVALVLGAGYSGGEEALNELATSAGFGLQIQRELDGAAMAELMGRCRVGLVAFGTTAYELMALGRPALVFTHYRWQDSSAHFFAQLGALEYLGCGEQSPDPAKVGQKLAGILGNQESLGHLAQRGPSLIDGKGAERVADLLETYAMETQQRQLDVLFVVAHPGDELLGAGATLLKRIRAGERVGLVVLGEGVASRWSGDEPTGEQQDARHLLKSALQRVVEGAGLQTWYYYRFEDNRFDNHDLLDLVKVVETVVERHRPHTVYTHHPADMNIDHRLCFEAVMTALRPQTECPVTTIFSMETPSSTDWGQVLDRSRFLPNWFEPVSETLEDKLALLAEYGSEIRPDPHPRSMAAIRDLAVARGRQTGLPAAEAFVLQRHIAGSPATDKESFRES